MGGIFEEVVLTLHFFQTCFFFPILLDFLWVHLFWGENGRKGHSGWKVGMSRIEPFFFCWKRRRTVFVVSSDVARRNDASPSRTTNRLPLLFYPEMKSSSHSALPMRWWRLECSFILSKIRLFIIKLPGWLIKPAVWTTTSRALSTTVPLCKHCSSFDSSRGGWIGFISKTSSSLFILFIVGGGVGAGGGRGGERRGRLESMKVWDTWQ